MKKILIILCLLGLMSPAALAETIWDVAPGRTSVKFKVKHLMFSQVEGKFKQFEGKVITKNDRLNDGYIEATINSNSIYTGNSDRDKHLTSEDFFYTNQYPTITFKSRSIEATDEEGKYRILGDLTMRGVTKPVELLATCSDKKDLSNGKTRMDLVATGSVNRFDYDLKWNELIETGNAIVGEDVQLSLNIALLRDQI